MDKVILKHRFLLGKINVNGTENRINEVEIKLELRKCGGDRTFTVVNGTRKYTGSKTPTFTELSICGDVWNQKHTDIVWGGQCLDHIYDVRNQMTAANRAIFERLYKLWRNWHLNGMHAGTPEQEKAVAEWKAAGNEYDYKAACEMLKERGLYEVPFTGKTVGRKWNGEPYRYGSGWIVHELPRSVLKEVKALCGEES